MLIKYLFYIVIYGKMCQNNIKIGGDIIHECLLCERDMKKSKTVFGNGCINNIYKFLEFPKPGKGKNKEQFLYKNIMKKTNISSINKEQKIWLTDRYLTYQYIDKLQYGNFTKLKLV